MKTPQLNRKCQSGAAKEGKRKNE